MPNIFNRTGPTKTLLTATTIPDTNTNACTNTFQAKANRVRLFVTTTGAANTITFTAALSEDDTTFYDVDKEWTVEASGAGTYVVNLDGLPISLHDYVKVYYQAESAVGDLTVKSLNYMTPGGSGGSVDLSTATEDDAAPSEGMPIVGKVATSQRSAMADGDAMLLTLNDHGELVLNGFNWTGEYLTISENEPLDSKSTGSVIADVTNGDDDTYEYFVELSTKKACVLQGLLDGGSGSVTVTIQGTCQDDGTAAADCDYLDISQYGLVNLLAASTAANYTADFMLALSETVRLKYIKITVEADTTGEDDADWTIYSYESAI